MQKYTKLFYMREKLWETEKFVLNLETGELNRALDRVYIRGINFEDASKNLIRAKFFWLRLTGNWFYKEQIMGESRIYEEDIGNEDEGDEEDDYFDNYISPKKKGSKTGLLFTGDNQRDYELYTSDPVEITSELGFDGFLDWLGYLSTEYVDKVYRFLRVNNHMTQANIVKGFKTYKDGN
jgi:hypothetical protein